MTGRPADSRGNTSANAKERFLPARLLILLLAALLAVVGVACGGDAGEDAETLLRETFTGDKQVDSGRLALSVAVDGDAARQVPGPLSLTVSGPFQRRGENELPRFDLDARVSAAGMSFEAGAVSTSEAGFVSLEGQDYAVAEAVFEEFRAGFREARADKQSSAAESQRDLPTLGIDPRRWIENARVAGEAEVGDAETVRIVGDVDVPKLLEDIGQVAERARGSGGGGAHPAPGLTAERRRELAAAIEAMSIEIFTGADDRILRRIVLQADLRGAGDDAEGRAADARLDYSITELNEDQQIDPPQDPRPFEELERRLRRLGIR